MKNIPSKIYIQVGTERPDVFDPANDEYSWCQDKIWDTDLVFINPDDLVHWASCKKGEHEHDLGDVYNMGYAKAMKDLLSRLVKNTNDPRTQNNTRPDRR